MTENSKPKINFRHKVQILQAVEIARQPELMDFIRTNSKWSNLGNCCYKIIFNNFIELNEATCWLLCKIYAQIIAHNMLHGFPMTFNCTAYSLTECNNSIKVKKNPYTTARRLKRLEEYGIIKRLPTPDKKGSYYIITADLKQPFRKPKNKELPIELKPTKIDNTTPMSEDEVKIFDEVKERESAYLQEIKSKHNDVIMNCNKEDIESLMEKKKQMLLSMVDEYDKAREAEYSEDEIEEQKTEIEQQIEKQKEELINETKDNFEELKYRSQLDNETKALFEAGEITETEFKQYKNFEPIKIGGNISKNDETEDSQEENDDVVKMEDIDNDIVRLDKLNIGDHDRDEFNSMFIDFISERKTNSGKKLIAKNQRGITLAINELYRAQEAGLNPYDVLFRALADNWQGINAQVQIDEKQKQTGIIKNNYYREDNYISNPVIKQQEQQDAIELTRQIASGEIKNTEELIEKTKTTASYAMNLQQNINKEQAKVDAKKHVQTNEQKQAINQQMAENQIITILDGFDETKCNNAICYLNIFDGDYKNIQTGKGCFNLVIKYFSKKIANKYPQDLERKKDFEANVISTFQNMSAMGNNKYIPLVYAYRELKNMPEDWMERTEDRDLLINFKNEARINKFLSIEASGAIINEDLVVGVGYKKMIKGYSFKGCYMEGVSKEEEVVQKMLNLFIARVMEVSYLNRQPLPQPILKELIEWRYTTTGKVVKEDGNWVFLLNKQFPKEVFFTNNISQLKFILMDFKKYLNQKMPNKNVQLKYNNEIVTDEMFNKPETIPDDSEADCFGIF